MIYRSIENVDPDIARVIADEIDRQQNTLELIASENITSTAVMAVQGSVLTNKYAEGYPGKRYYGGCEHVDVAEKLAVERQKNYSMRVMQTYSPTRGHRPTWLYILLC